jgi:AraC-like DNA-binding protein
MDEVTAQEEGMAPEPMRPEPSKRLGARVSKLIRIQLARGKVGVETVAGQLNMSRYTLHKKLRQEGVTFAHLLEQVRREQALAYMRDQSKPLVEIAEQLGFSELSAFSRAFKRWMGKPPAEYRSLTLS